MKKKHTWIRAFVTIIVAIIVIGIISTIGSIIINECYKKGAGYVTMWDARDMLNYYGMIVGSVVTMVGLVITIQFTRKQIQRDSFLKSEGEKWTKLEAIFADILNKINPMPTLQQTMDTGFTNPREALNSLQKYQISCQTATDQLNAYLNTRDYPRVKALIDKIADVSEKLFQVSKKEVEKYDNLQQWQLRDSAFKLLEMAEERPGALPAEGIAKCREIIKNSDGICFEDIEHAIQELHVELIRIYETDFKSLLQLKGTTFETIQMQTQKNADSILSLRRK